MMFAYNNNVKHEAANSTPLASEAWHHSYSYYPKEELERQAKDILELIRSYFENECQKELSESSCYIGHRMMRLLNPEMGYDPAVFTYVDNIRMQDYQNAVEKAKVFRKYGVNVMTPARPTQSSRRLVAAIAKIERRRRLKYERLLQEKQNLWREQQKLWKEKQDNLETY